MFVKPFHEHIQWNLDLITPNLVSNLGLVTIKSIFFRENSLNVFDLGKSSSKPLEGKESTSLEYLNLLSGIITPTSSPSSIYVTGR